MRRTALLGIVTCGLAACRSESARPTPQPGATPPDPAPVALTWEPDPFADDAVLVAGDHLILRERRALLAVDGDGRLRWRRDLPVETPLVVPLGNGELAIAEADDRIVVIDRDGRERATHVVPRSASAGVAVGDSGDAVFFLGGGAMLGQLRGGAITTVELAQVHLRASEVAVDPRGRLWANDDGDGWSVRAADGAPITWSAPEGNDADWSFPPAFVGDTAWMYRWREGTVAELSQLDVTRCASRDADADACVVRRTPLPEYNRAPIIASRDGVVVLSHGSVMHDDQSGFIDQTVAAYRDGASLWSHDVGDLGPALPLVICGGHVAVLAGGKLARFQLQTGAAAPAVRAPGRWLECLGDRVVVASANAVTSFAPPPG